MWTGMGGCSGLWVQWGVDWHGGWSAVGCGCSGLRVSGCRLAMSSQGAASDSER